MLPPNMSSGVTTVTIGIAGGGGCAEVVVGQVVITDGGLAGAVKGQRGVLAYVVRAVDVADLPGKGDA